MVHVIPKILDQIKLPIHVVPGKNGTPELIANGEPIEVKRVHGIEERYGLRFADITAGWWNGNDYRELDAKVMMDTLSVEAPALPGPQMRLLQQSVMAGMTARNKGQLYRMLKEDPYANALQVKYAYAVTAHKAQGGQWQAVFVDQGYVTEEMLSLCAVPPLRMLPLGLTVQA